MVGSRAPSLELPDTEGALHSLADPGRSPASVVVWTCNHCPYALGWHERIVAVARDYAARGARFLAVNSNDSERYPADSPEAMRARVEAGEFGQIPYLHDSSQASARAWNAQTTPHVYVLDGELTIRYEGAPDGDYSDPSRNAAWLRGALDAVLDGREPEPAATDPVGCSIKWK
jgi:hypothetical protein